jgi:hypothetical protein
LSSRYAGGKIVEIDILADLRVRQLDLPVLDD